MLSLNVELDASSTRCLVYKHRESGMRGKLHIKTSDRLKLRQISIRLVATELVDLHTGESGNSLHPLLRKSSRTIGTWIIWKRGDPTADPHSTGQADASGRHAMGVLDAGDHHYSFEIPLPKALDGTIESSAYSLRYELETRLEHSFKLKPDSVHVTGVELVQVPMALNLHADDRISLRMVALRPEHVQIPIQHVPLGHSVCLRADSIDRKESFVLAHVWDGQRLGVRLRLPRGRVFPEGSEPLVDVEAVPLTKGLRFTRLTLALEEISIVARPLIAGAMPSGASLRGKGKEAEDLGARRPSLAGSLVSQASGSSEDALPARPSHNAWAYAQECSSEYHNAITRVRELSRTTSHLHESFSMDPSAEHAQRLGILLSKSTLRVPPTQAAASEGSADRLAHTDIRNSHIQVHHQLVYELEYGGPAALVDDAAEAEADALRIRAVAQVYSQLQDCNIVRREEAKGTQGVVRGTLPVAVVARRISDLWGIRMLSEDPEVLPSALRSILANAEPLDDEPIELESLEVAEAVEPETSSAVDGQYRERTKEEMYRDEMSSYTPPESVSTAATVVPQAVPLATAATTPLVLGPTTSYTLPLGPTLSQPLTASNDSAVAGLMLPPITLPPLSPIPAMPPMSPIMQPPGTTSAPVDSVAWGHMMFQEQMRMFQEQQRLQQEQFIRQLSEQYAQLMMAGSPGTGQQQQQQQQPTINTPVDSTSASMVQENNVWADATPIPASLLPVSSVPSAQSVGASTYETAGEAAPDTEHVPQPPATGNPAAGSSVNSPPPDYEDLLPPEYDVPRNQPPPYMVMEMRRRRNT
ncbi:hypothetical protein LPJ53_004213 [Coemansia erecta]|uniref:Uncharacterized protein n=1 Tax=Coemansia erecta TaxID=147472 RepID=A0A9W7XUR6_9FUNG|nr:hypothetical protein LPJ53_004213 [Coemansia erecta]